MGGSEDCGPEDEVCNGPLDPDTEYNVRYRLFSGELASDFPFAEDVFFSTGQCIKSSPLSLTQSSPFPFSPYMSI